MAYITSQGERLLAGAVRIDPRGGSGILCGCCGAVVSCSQFEAHAGRGSRRAPYDNIFTAAGISLRRLASLMPAAEAEEPAHYRAARGAGAAADRCAAAHRVCVQTGHRAGILAGPSSRIQCVC